MSERKVLNKYYPPDFDPSKIPRVKMAKNRQYTVRLMAPFNMKCVICGEYIYKGKKFNAQKEDVENNSYLGVRIYRFYIKCPRCLGEIAFKTDPEKADYEIEAGATRNFMALKLAVEQEERKERELREQEASNPMTVLEKRTEQSKNEIDCLENLERLKDLNKRQRNIDYDSLLAKYSDRLTEEQLQQLDREYVKTIQFGSTTASTSGRIVSEEILEVRDLWTEEPFVTTATATATTTWAARKRNLTAAGFSDQTKRGFQLSDIKIRKKSKNADTVVAAPKTPEPTAPKSALELLASYSSDSDDEGGNDRETSADGTQ